MDKALCFSCYFVGNDSVDSNNITFNIKDTKLYVPVVTLAAKDNQKLSKYTSNGIENKQ